MIPSVCHNLLLMTLNIWKLLLCLLAELQIYLLILFFLLALVGNNTTGWSTSPPFTLHTVAIWTFTFHKKTRLCVVNLEGQFQTSLEAKLINFLIWKFRSIILIFLLFFAGIVKSSAFWTLSMLFQKGWVTFLCQIAI